MRGGSLFTGIGGFDLGLERAGITTAWQVEIDAACQELLGRHFKHAKRETDIRQVGRHNLEPVDILFGGFPCQDISMAGQRAGLAGERSGLWYEFARIIDELTPPLIVIENVPGLLSSCGCTACGAVRRIIGVHKYLRAKRQIAEPCAICTAGGRMLKSHHGRDFALIIRWLAERGYSVVWRILDSRYFGVPQRRRRVFIVASLTIGRATEILFEPEGLSGDFAASPASAKTAARTIARGARGRGAGTVIGTLAANAGGLNRPAGNANETDFVVPVFFNADRDGSDMSLIAPTLTHKGDGPQAHSAYHKVAIAWNYNSSMLDHSSVGAGVEIAPTLTGWGKQAVGARRLTPIECERLQGFPDDWTAGFSDAVRYRMLGNAVTVNVSHWLGQRIVRSD